MSDKLFEAITQQKEQTEQAVQPLYGSLGIPLGGQKLVEVPNRKSFVYVRLRDNQSEVIQAFNNKVAPSYNLPVVIVREGNRYIISGVDTQRYQNNWVSYAPYLPRHGNTHSFDTDNGGAGDVVFVHGRQFLPLLVFPSGTLGGPNAMVSPHVLESVSGTWMYVGNTGTQNLLQYVPTGSNAVMILVYLNRVTGNPGIVVNSGSYFSNTITGTAAVTPFIPAVRNPMTDIPIGAIRLASGTSIINWNNIYEVRQFNQFIATGSLGSTIFIQDEGIPKGIASILNFVGPNVDVTISGSTARIFVTGSTGGGVPTLLSGSIVLADESGVLTSRPWLKYEDADEAIQFGANKIRWGGNAGKIYYADYMYILGGGEAFPRVTVMHDDVYISNSLTTRFISGSVMLLDGLGQIPLGIRNNNIDIFYIDTSGTAHSNNTPLIKEAPANNTTYGRKNSGWEPILPISTAYIDGLGINYISSGTISVNPGTAYVPGLGKFVTVTGTITRAFPIPVPTGTWQHIYLWEDGSTPSIQVTGTVPSNPYSGRARTKSGNENYRFLGSLLPDNAGYIYPFVAGVVGGSLDITWKTQNSLAPFALNPSITTPAPVTLSIAGLIPGPGIADGIYMIGQLTVPATTVGAAGIGGTLLTYITNPFQSGDSYFRLENQTGIDETSFFPPSLIKITGNTIQAAVNNSTVTLSLRSNGIRIPRS